MSDNNDTVLETQLRDYAGPPIPADFSTALLEKLERRLPRSYWQAWWAAAGLAAAAVVAVVLWLGQGPGQRPLDQAAPPAMADKFAPALPAPLGPFSNGAFWATAFAAARSEKMPEPTLDDLLAAECVAVGHFTDEQGAEGKVTFVVERMLKGDAALVRQRATALTIRHEPDGVLTVTEVSRRGFSMLGRASYDARALGLWFFGVTKAMGQVSRQPAELADGFAALLAGKEPGLLFDLLQHLDFDKRWAALEKLFADRQPEVIARLHELALRPDCEVALEATADLAQTRLLDAQKFAGKWFHLPAAWMLRDALAARDNARMMDDLRKAIAAETDPARLDNLLNLIPYNAPEKLDLVLPYVNHPAARVRETAICRVWDVFWDLNDKAARSPEAREKVQTLGQRVVPLLEKISATEDNPTNRQRLDQMLARENGVPWLLRIPAQTIHEPIPAYSEAEEEKFLINCLTSRNQGGFISITAGRELAERFYESAAASLQAAADNIAVFNPDIVVDGMGYVRDARMFEYLVSHARSIGPGHRTARATIRAIGVQNQKGSLAALKELLANKAKDKYKFQAYDIGLVDGLRVLDDPDALAFLKELEPRIEYHCKVPYLRARAAHGDPWAVAELLAGLEQPPTSQFLGASFWNRDDVARALCDVETPQATAALRKYVEENWPTAGRDGFPPQAQLENHAGPMRRSDPLAEIARRDPQWLAGLALAKMGSTSWAARWYGADIFAQLTGQTGSYRADLFASERATTLAPLQAWWQTHQSQTREQWLIEYFRGRGFMVDRLDKSALPTLARALEADFFTHNLAVEQISAICGKYFADFRHQESSQGQQRMNARVLGWLRARGLLAGQ